MWIFVWLLLSSILIGATLWSWQILRRQKAAWEIFAKSKNFTYNRGTTMGPVEMSGVIGDYKLAFFTAERQGEDVRSKRYLTVLEIVLTEGLIDGGAIGTKEMLPFMQSLNLLKPFTIDTPEWDKNSFAFMRNDIVAKAFLTPERIEIISQILKTRNADTLVIFNDHELVVRLETPDPMQDADKIDKITRRLMALCDKLRLTTEQRAQFAAMVV